MSSNTKWISNTFLSSHDEELSQSAARLIFILILYSYFFINLFMFSAEQPSLLGKWLIAAYPIYALVHYVWIRIQKTCRLRIVMAIIADISIVSIGIYYMAWSGFYVYPLYLWIILGNGIRFGELYLFGAMALSIIEFGFILSHHPLWLANPEMGRGFMGVIIILPIFFLVMIKRLKSATSRLHDELILRRQQEAIMVQQARSAAMGEMIGNIAHQWRQPLNALSLLLQNLIFAYETGRLDRELIDRVDAKGNLLISKMSHTIDDFRNFFKPNREKETVEISVQLGKTLELLQASLDNHQITVNTSVDSGLYFNGFPNEFSQVLLNLISNAKDVLIERQISNPTITIRCYRNEAALKIDIADNAGGIKEDIMDKVFDPYFTTKEEGKGTGIGLYMSKVIIENNMNGRLSARNETQGATFSIYLPYPSVEAAL